MRIESVSMFKFYFAYEGTELMIPIAAADETQAKAKLTELFRFWSGDLAVPNGSVLSPVQQKDTPMPMIPAVPAGPLLELRIEELLKTIADAKLRVTKQTVAATVKDWTGFKHDPANFPAILEELEKIKRGL